MTAIKHSRNFSARKKANKFLNFLCRLSPVVELFFAAAAGMLFIILLASSFDRAIDQQMQMTAGQADSCLEVKP